VPTAKRATMNGLAMTVGSVAKAVGPILGSVGYAWCVLVLSQSVSQADNWTSQCVLLMLLLL
jgi:hypothetical protein